MVGLQSVGCRCPILKPLALNPHADTEVHGAWWGFMLGAGGAALADQTLADNRLPVVFDLDDTLLLAYSPSTMDTKIRGLTQSR